MTGDECGSNVQAVSLSSEALDRKKQSAYKPESSRGGYGSHPRSTVDVFPVGGLSFIPTGVPPGA